MNRVALLFLGLTSIAFAAEPRTRLAPIMLVRDKVVVEDNFSRSGAIKKSIWQARQGTRWSVEDGVLRGQPASLEYQSSKADHAGKEPRIAVPTTPKDCVVELSVRFHGGEETSLTPLVEIGHHVCRLRFSEAASELLADHESVRVHDAKGFQYKPGQWYRMLWELRGDEVVIQIENGPILYARHPSYAEAPKVGAAGLGIAGPRGGEVEIDDVSIHSVKSGTQPGWEARKKLLAKFAAEEIGPKKKSTK